MQINASHGTASPMKLSQTDVSMSDRLSRYLDLSADQMKVTASNMANVDTPGYKTQGFDFEAELNSALKRGTQTPDPKLADVDGLVARPDGNTVSLDREGIELAKSQLQFKLGVEFMKNHYTRMMSAIHADTK